jgi:hypothetical protein
VAGITRVNFYTCGAAYSAHTWAQRELPIAGQAVSETVQSPAWHSCSKGGGANGTVRYSPGRSNFALHLGDLCRRYSQPVPGARWRGRQGFRPELTTDLFELGVPADVAQTILRHANVSTTRTHYIVLESQQAAVQPCRS